MNNAINELRKRVDDLKCLADMEQRNEGSEPLKSTTTLCFLAKREGILESIRTFEECEMNTRDVIIKKLIGSLWKSMGCDEEHMQLILENDIGMSDEDLNKYWICDGSE